jgi:hypothetical protein
MATLGTAEMAHGSDMNQNKHGFPLFAPARGSDLSHSAGNPS